MFVKTQNPQVKTLDISIAVGPRFYFGILRIISLYMQGPQNLKYFCELVFDNCLSVAIQ